MNLTEKVLGGDFNQSEPISSELDNSPEKPSIRSSKSAEHSEKFEDNSRGNSTAGRQEGVEYGDEVLSVMSGPQVAIYHTHTSESYLPTSGKERVTGEESGQGGIVKVGEVLAENLEEFNVGVVHKRMFMTTTLVQILPPFGGDGGAAGCRTPRSRDDLRYT